MSTATYNIMGDNGVKLCKQFKIFHNFHQILMATDLQVFVQETVNAPLVWASLVWITV